DVVAHRPGTSGGGSAAQTDRAECMTDTSHSTEDGFQAETPEAEPVEELTIEDLRAQLDEAQAGHARARADYANLERRSQEQRFEVGRVALIEAVRGFLPVLDDLLRAVEAAESEATEPAWVEGIRLVAQKFRTTLGQHGVEEI